LIELTISTKLHQLLISIFQFLSRHTNTHTDRRH